MKNLFNIFYSLCFSMVFFEQNSLCSERNISPNNTRSESKTPSKICDAPWASFLTKKVGRKRSSDSPLTPEDELEQESAKLVYRTLGSSRNLCTESKEDNQERAWRKTRAHAYTRMVEKYMEMHRDMLPTSPLSSPNKEDELKKQARLDLEMHECTLFDKKINKAIKELNDAIEGRDQWCIIL